MNEFSAKIEILNVNPYVSVPAEILQQIFAAAGKSKGTIPVRGKINGADYIQTLVRYAGDWRLYVNMIMLKAAGVKFKAGEMNKVVGTEVHMSVEYDPKPRTLPLHPHLQKVLAKDPRAKQAYEALAPYRKQEINKYLGSLKTPEKIELNIQRLLKHLKGEETDALYPLMHRKK